ncbi:hypothetical protein [Gracilimonas sp. BCB1]|uniref:hypothetical protein n=1 Tax=Gracilimonas sp. BCB1 TaxID=3152362 RepID=UPI0032D955EE
MIISKKSAFNFLVLGLSLVMAISCGKAEQNKGSEVESNQVQAINEDSSATEKMYIEMDIEGIPSLKRGDSLEISVTGNEGENMNLQIRRVQEMMPGITSVSAFVGSSETGQATLTVKGQKVTGIIDLFDQKKKYTFAYDSAASSYYLQPINPEDMDVLPGSKPLSPNE